MEVIQNFTKHFLIFFYRKFQPNLDTVILTQGLVLHFCLSSDTFSVNFLYSSTPVTLTPYVKALLVLRQIFVKVKDDFADNLNHTLTMPFRQKLYLPSSGQYLLPQPIHTACVYQGPHLTKIILASETSDIFSCCDQPRSNQHHLYLLKPNKQSFKKPYLQIILSPHF